MNAFQNIYRAPCVAQVMALIHFGRSVPRGAEIVDAHSFETFLAESVTPHFPGFTVSESVGYWKGKRELCYTLSIMSGDSDTFRATCRQIAEHYVDRFKQEAVMVSFVPAQFSFETWPHAGTGYRAGHGGTSGKL